MRQRRDGPVRRGAEPIVADLMAPSDGTLPPVAPLLPVEDNDAVQGCRIVNAKDFTMKPMTP